MSEEKLEQCYCGSAYEIDRLDDYVSCTNRDCIFYDNHQPPCAWNLLQKAMKAYEEASK